LNPKTQLLVLALRAQLLESKIQRSAKNYVILMSLNVNQAKRSHRKSAGGWPEMVAILLATSVGQWAKNPKKRQKQLPKLPAAANGSRRVGQSRKSEAARMHIKLII